MTQRTGRLPTCLPETPPAHPGSRRGRPMLSHWDQRRRRHEMADPNKPDAGASPPLPQLSAALATLVAGAAPYIVSVLSHRSRASGFVWRPGLIVTASEALAEEGEIAVVLPGGERLPATLAGRDPTTDIALLRINRIDVPQSTLATEPVAPGALAVTVGARDGVPVAALGIVS